VLAGGSHVRDNECREVPGGHCARVNVNGPNWIWLEPLDPALKITIAITFGVLIIPSSPGRQQNRGDAVAIADRKCSCSKAAPLSRPTAEGREPQRIDSRDLSTYYLFMADINTRALDRELKRGSAELLILSLLDARPRHGYELSKLIHTRSNGQLTFHIDSLYPLLYRLEERGWIKGTWVEKPDERRRRFYRVTAEGRRVLAQQRKTWAAFVEAVRRVTGDEHA
jgi:transcriptional regulator